MESPLGPEGAFPLRSVEVESIEAESAPKSAAGHYRRQRQPSPPPPSRADRILDSEFPVIDGSRSKIRGPQHGLLRSTRSGPMGCVRLKSPAAWGSVGQVSIAFWQPEIRSV